MAATYEKERAASEEYGDAHDARRCLYWRDHFVSERKGPRDEVLALVIGEAESIDPSANAAQD